MRPDDIRILRRSSPPRLERPEAIALITKIETGLAIRNLPELIVEGDGTQLARGDDRRGDLAVEVGFRRLAELQEEMLWLCEAAHVPVIWATQVLDRFVQRASARGPRSPTRRWPSGPSA